MQCVILSLRTWVYFGSKVKNFKASSRQRLVKLTLQRPCKDFSGNNRWQAGFPAWLPRRVWPMAGRPARIAFTRSRMESTLLLAAIFVLPGLWITSNWQLMRSRKCSMFQVLKAGFSCGIRPGAPGHLSCRRDAFPAFASGRCFGRGRWLRECPLVSHFFHNHMSAFGDEALMRPKFRRSNE